MSETLLNSYGVNRKKLTVAALGAPSGDVAYWRTQSPQARWRALELMRQINYGQAATTARLKRVLEIVQRAPR